MTPLESKLSEKINSIAVKQSKPVLRNMVSRSDAKEMCIESMKQLLSLPEIHALVEALKFYGDKESWHEFISGGNIGTAREGDFMQAFDTPNNDDGEHARMALAKWNAFVQGDN